MARQIHPWRPRGFCIDAVGDRCMVVYVTEKETITCQNLKIRRRVI